MNGRRASSIKLKWNARGLRLGRNLVNYKKGTIPEKDTDGVVVCLRCFLEAQEKPNCHPREWEVKTSREHGTPCLRHLRSHHLEVMNIIEKNRKDGVEVDWMMRNYIHYIY